MTRTMGIILIVDDDPIGRELLVDILCDAGYQCVTVGSGAEALSCAATLLPDLILLDVMMPAMDGFEVCHRLRGMTDLGEIPIILITALNDRESRIRGLESGADDFLSKPIDIVELKTRVYNITRLNRYRQLLAERAKFGWMADHADAGYITTSNDDQIRYANPLARRYLSLAEEDIPEAYTFLALARRTYNCEPQPAWATWPATAEYNETRYLVQPETLDHHAFWLQVDIFDLPGDMIEHRLVRLHDVTALMSLQHDMCGFHAMVAHKLRTPMMGLQGSLSMIMQSLPPDMDPSISELVEIAWHSMQRLAYDIEDIMQYIYLTDRVHSDQGYCLADLPSTVAAISGRLGITAMVMTDQIDLDTICVSLAPGVMMMILQEILYNSCKFHPQHSPHVQIYVLPFSNNMIRLQIADNGRTLNAHEIKYIFSPYYQAEKVFTGEQTGMGLGLAKIATLIWRIGGTCAIMNRDTGPGIVVDLKIPKIIDDKKVDEHI